MSNLETDLWAFLKHAQIASKSDLLNFKAIEIEVAPQLPGSMSDLTYFLKNIAVKLHNNLLIISK